MGGRQSTTLWNADNPSSSRVFDVDKTGLGARAAHIHLSSTSDVYVNDEPPDHAPLITGTGRFVYVTNVTSKSDVKKCKVDLSGKWNENELVFCQSRKMTSLYALCIRVCLAVEQGDMVTDASPQFLNPKPQTRRPLALPPPSRTRQTDGMDEDYTQSDQLDMDVTYPATDDTISFTEAPSENKESMSVKPANLGNEMVEAASSTEKYDLGDFVTPSVLPPKTNLHHNDNPFIIGITHASRKCLRSRYPYSHKGMLLASQQLILRQTEADKLFLLKEFDVDLNSLGVAIRYVAHPRFKVSFKKDPSFLSDSFYRNLQVSARENRRFKIDRIFIHFHRHHLELFPRIALLWGRNMRQRAYELIQIAHPDQRQNLE
ncbi:hypothetical protein PRIPAC_85013 [Pristionchus pacificus]|uniref:Uncharacterized protein n=1 Tax=Pristionchus pacificus TaxID=54126 RepID=A0A2A6CCR2_PRIPA|nr:hypothetical protein PRIPAC_85013 [Pristionchus pacificus]|eukprot:PDM75906.1 hypothetical protein PRIPAC_43749 [Pristionchus pacificus]